MSTSDRSYIESLLGEAIPRREAVCRGLAAGLGLLLGNHVTAFGRPSTPKPRTTSKAKAVIQVWLWGGASHTDTFDPKPEAGNDYTGPAQEPHRHQCAGNQDRRTAAPVGQAGRQVFAHPQHDSWEQQPRDGSLHGSNGAAAGRTRRLSVGRRRRFAVQRVQCGLQGADSALHRRDAAARPVLRGGLLGADVSSPSQPAEIRARADSSWKAWWRRESPSSGRRTVASCSMTSIRWSTS